MGEAARFPRSCTTALGHRVATLYNHCHHCDHGAKTVAPTDNTSFASGHPRQHGELARSCSQQGPLLARATSLAEQLAAFLSPRAQECTESAADAERGWGTHWQSKLFCRWRPSIAKTCFSKVHDWYLGQELAMAALPAVAPAWWAQGRAPRTARAHELRQQLCTARCTRETD